MSAWLELLAPVAMTVTLVIVGMISRRFGKATRAPSYYIGFFVGALLLGASALARLLQLLVLVTPATALHDNAVWLLLLRGLPALAITLSIIVAWRYWSWLLAERD